MIPPVPPNWRNRFRGFAVPKSETLNVRTATDGELREFGIPPKPDKFLQPAQYKAWSRVFGRRLQFVKFVVPEELTADYRPFLMNEPLGAAATRFMTSRNWSGASIDANSGKSFVQVFGQWIVPTPQPPAGAALPPVGGTIEYQCAAWIGLDGQRLYRNSSLPQIGTMQAVTVAPDGSQTFRNEAWTQWWDRGDINSLPLPIKHFPVNHGDVICCAVTVITEQIVWLNIVNFSASPFPKVASVWAVAPSVTLPNGTNLELSISGATAEWVMERPAIPGTDTLRPFPDYGSTEFSDCIAFEAFEGWHGLAAENIRSPRFIRLYEVRGFPQRTAYLSMPNRIDDWTFEVTYGDFTN